MTHSNRERTYRSLLALLLGCGVFVSVPVRACDVPVFRYGLERWPADPYDMLLFHRGPMDEEARHLAGMLGRAGREGNARVRLVDLSSPIEEPLRRIWMAQRDATPPWLVVLSPTRVPVWTGRLTSTALEKIMDSPVRREVAGRILKGEAAVWLLLESGQVDRDDQAVRVLAEEIDRLNRQTHPALGASTRMDSVTFRFSTVRLSRADPAEEMLVRVLLHSELDLLAFSEPMAFPVFGRGRILYALVGDGINAENIREACSFITGACSCEVKALNPGSDLLMSVNWVEQLRAQGIGGDGQGTLNAFGGITPASDSSPRDGGEVGILSMLWTGPIGRNLKLVMGFTILLIGAATYLVWRRNRA